MVWSVWHPVYVQAVQGVEEGDAAAQGSAGAAQVPPVGARQVLHEVVQYRLEVQDCASSSLAAPAGWLMRLQLARRTIEVLHALADGRELPAVPPSLAPAA